MADVTTWATVEHFEESAVIAELQSSCPEVYKLVQQLSSTHGSNLHSFERTGEGLAVNGQSYASG